MPKPEELPEGRPSDLFKEALQCLDIFTGQYRTSRLSEIGPLIWQSARTHFDLALWEAVECFYLDSIQKPKKRQQSQAIKRFSSAINYLRKTS